MASVFDCASMAVLIIRSAILSLRWSGLRSGR
jgi:hypothetical protein